MIEVNKNELASAMTALGKLICRTSPLALCKSIKIEASEGVLRLSTCGLYEEVSFQAKIELGEDSFCCMVGFDEFRDAVRGGRTKSLSLALESGTLQVGERYLMTVKDAEWPDFTVADDAKSCELPENVVGMFAKAAQIVDRTEPREILRGINLSADGITTTNGKEPLNYNTPFELETSITIPLPLALMQRMICRPPNGRRSAPAGPYCLNRKSIAAKISERTMLILSMTRVLIFAMVFLILFPDITPRDQLEMYGYDGIRNKLFMVEPPIRRAAFPVGATKTASGKAFRRPWSSVVLPVPAFPRMM